VGKVDSSLKILSYNFSLYLESESDSYTSSIEITTLPFSTKAVTLFKYILLFVSLLSCAHLYIRIRQTKVSDLGIVQAKVFVLVVLLVLFNEPFYGISFI